MEYHANVCACCLFSPLFSTVLFYHNGILFLHLAKERRKRKGEDDREGGSSQFCLFSFAKPVDKSFLASFHIPFPEWQPQTAALSVVTEECWELSKGFLCAQQVLHPRTHSSKSLHH